MPSVPPSRKHSQRLARGALLVDRAIAKTRSHSFNHFFDARIVERPHQETQWILKRRPTEAVQFPNAQMSGQKNDAALVFFGFSQMGQAHFVVLNYLAQLLRSCVRKLTKLAQQPAEALEGATQQSQALSFRHSGKAISRLRRPVCRRFPGSR